mmetsp:Transcript_19967/g.50891  ORF Transcript_19967/g.50891 Transcript_19967/m.50891 type:complete len:282 (-) Transcript_19967:1571-2416(-)
MAGDVLVHVHLARALERRLAEQHLVHEHAKCPVVRCQPMPLALDHLGRQVVGRAAGGEGLPLDALGEAEVGKLHVAAAVEHQVLRVDVAEGHALVVQRAERLREGGDVEAHGGLAHCLVHNRLEVREQHTLEHRMQRGVRGEGHQLEGHAGRGEGQLARQLALVLEEQQLLLLHCRGLAEAAHGVVPVGLTRSPPPLHHDGPVVTRVASPHDGEHAEVVDVGGREPNGLGFEALDERLTLAVLGVCVYDLLQRAEHLLEGIPLDRQALGRPDGRHRGRARF